MIPAASGMASTLDSTKCSTSVLPELAPREIWPTLTTSGVANTGPGIRVGATMGVGPGAAMVAEALGEGSGDGGRKTTAATMTANARAPTSTDATTARNVLSLIVHGTPALGLGSAGRHT